MIVAQGCYTLIIDGQRIALRAGQEYFIPKACRTPAKSWPGQERFTLLADTGRTEFGGNLAFAFETYFTTRKSPMAMASMPAQ